MQIKSLDDAQNVLLSNDYSIQQLCELAQILANSNLTSFSALAYNKAFYQDVTNDQTLSSYISLLVSNHLFREALDLLLHAICDIHKTENRVSWIYQITTNLPQNQDWQKKLKQLPPANNVEFRQLLDLETYCAFNGIEYNKLSDAKLINQQLADNSPQPYKRLFSGVYKQANINYATIPNVQVSASSFALYQEDYAILREFNIRNRDKFNLTNDQEEILLYVPKYRASTLHGITKKLTPSRLIKGLCLSLLSPESDNFYLTLCELLPKILLAKKLYSQEQLTILLSKNKASLCLPILHYFVSDLNIELVDTDEVISVENALVFDGLLSNPAFPSVGIYPLLNDYYVSDVAVSLIPKTLVNQTMNKKILITDNASTVPQDTKAINALIESKGFTAVSLKALPYQEIVDLFSCADYIIGYDPDALSNIVISEHGAKVLMLCPFETNEVKNMKLANLVQHTNSTLHFFTTINGEKLGVTKNPLIDVDIKELSNYLDNNFLHCDSPPDKKHY